MGLGVAILIGPGVTLSLTRRGIGFVPCLGFVDSVSASRFRTSRSDGCDLRGALASTVRVLSAVAAVGASSDDERRLQTWQVRVGLSLEVSTRPRTSTWPQHSTNEVRCSRPRASQRLEPDTTGCSSGCPVSAASAGVGIDGTGSYGAGLTRSLHASGIDVVEVNDPIDNCGVAWASLTLSTAPLDSTTIGTPSASGDRMMCPSPVRASMER